MTEIETAAPRPRRNWLAIIGISLAAVLVIGTFAWLIGNLQVTTDRLQNRPTDTNQVTQLRQTVSHDSTEIATLQSQLATVQSKLNAASPTGSLINCTDLRQFQQIFQVQGIDQLGGTIYSSEPGQPWVPAHCLKQ